MEIDWDADPSILAKVKLQARVETDEEDELVKGYVAAALSHVEQHCDCRLVEGEPAAPDEIGLTPDVWQAVYLLVAHWYANREAVALGTSATSVPLGVERILWYRKRF
ncbi:TPA: phage gp6-like head-tail connector protein [Pseudomonas aeruginosa]|uniref:head-tail connector protein n=1 Tax=Pseudomonas aeruginosa TaxID=287 RepID=UPI001E35FA86|nr:head-tail connector protein [Pseudomonas aeruginosa]MCD2763042.1 head-tail connector protein [Pseudomonas aeruginosa]MCW5341353.1 phage gp6-like head-tail connector protein [Pseudomonas aeruginosa]HBP0992571.1 phage gp6-like head-tail connector protein [Pseudomonas aeruginosa]HBP1202914.1 phage gp6-like head-tail connector protein [Pseudomonas aeruginosa]HCE7112079.1 phage gp6-like head-tail connector protein [Pseudomonas aeruginosa]